MWWFELFFQDPKSLVGNVARQVVFNRLLMLRKRVSVL
jgi:hypothetical protein